MAIASLRAGETISAGDALFVSSTGLVFKALGDTQDHASVVGLAVNGGAVGDLIRVNTDALYQSSTSYAPLERLYLSATTSGAYANYETVASGLELTSRPGSFFTEIGSAVTTNKINVEVSLPRYKVNTTSILLIESSAGVDLDAILQEDGTTIKTEDAV